MTNWGGDNKAIGFDTINEAVQTYQTFKKLEHLSLDFHGWGYRNPTIAQKEVVALVKGLEVFKGNLKTFELDLGRWGVEDYESYKTITDFTLSKIGSLIS